jgi:hypothetical protein
MNWRDEKNAKQRNTVNEKFGWKKWKVSTPVPSL